MRGEYIKIKKARELENSIKFQRKCLKRLLQELNCSNR